MLKSIGLYGFKSMGRQAKDEEIMHKGRPNVCAHTFGSFSLKDVRNSGKMDGWKNVSV